MKRIVLACAVSLVVAGVVWWGFAKRAADEASPIAGVAAVKAPSQPTGTPHVVRGDQENLGGGQQRADGRTSYVPPTRVRMMLPPVDAKVAEVVRQLQDAADQGDAHASCRLGIELQRCAAAYRSQTRRAGQPAPEVIAAGFESQAEKDAFLAGQRKVAAAIDSEISACQDISLEAAKKASEYLWRAANAGSVAAMSKYARDPPVNTEKAAEYADEILRYKNDAPRFLAGAVRGGDVMALYVSWFGAASGMSMLGTGVFARDPYTALVYATALQTLVAGERQQQVMGSIDGLRRELGAEKAKLAEGDGINLRQQYFSNPLPPASREDDGAVDATDCEQ